MAATAEIVPHRVRRQERHDGTVILHSELELGPVARTTLD